MGLIRDDRQGGLQKGSLKVQPHGGGRKLEQPQRISPPGFASGQPMRKEVAAPAPFGTKWVPVRPTLAARGGAMLQRQNPAHGFDPQYPKAFAGGAPFRAAGLRQRIQMRAMAASEGGDATLRPVSAKFRAYSDANAKPVDTGKLIAAQTPQIAGLAGAPGVQALSRSLPVRWAQQGALEAQNSLPGMMYLGQNYVRRLQRGQDPLTATFDTAKPVAEGIASQYGRIAAHPLRQLSKNPFDTTTALFPAFSAAARVGEGAAAAGAALKASEATGTLGPVREAAQAALRAGATAQRVPRFIATPGEGAAQALYSRSAGMRALQKMSDRLTGAGAPWARDVYTANKAKLNQMYREQGLHHPADGELGQVTPPETMSRAEVQTALLEHHLGNHQLTPLGNTINSTRILNHRVRVEGAQNEAGFKAIANVLAEKKAAAEGSPLPAQPLSVPGGVARGMDVLNAAGRLGQLYLKPSYLWANLLGQGGLTAAQQGLGSVSTAARALRIHHAMQATDGGRETLDMIHRALAGGITRAPLTDAQMAGLSKAEKAIIGIEKGTAGLYGKVLDDPWRFNAFIHEAGKLGYKTPQALYTLTHDPTKLTDFTMAQRRANNAMINYSRLGKNERNIARRAAYFYPWLKGATVYGGQFLGEHPNLSAITAELGREGTATTNQRLGDSEIPSFMQGMFISGHRNVPGLGMQPKGRNLAAASIFGTPAGIAQAVLGGGGQGAVGQTLSDFPSPATTFALRALFHYDPSTGRKISEPTDLMSSFMEAGKGLYQNTFPYRVAKDLPAKAGRVDKTNLLFPISKRDILSYAVEGPAASRPINEYARRSNYRSEVTGGMSDKGARDQLTVGKWLPEDLIRETNRLRVKHGLPEMTAKQSQALAGTVQQKLALKEVYDHYKVPGGGKMLPVDRLAALAEYAAKRQGGTVSPKMEALIRHFRNPDLPAAVRTKTIPEIVLAFEKALFPERTLPNKIAAPLKTAGARVTVPK